MKLFNRKLNLIVDSGATCSLIDQNYLPAGIRINVGEKINIRGVNGTTQSLGYIFTSLQYFSYKFFIKLHVVQSLPSHVIGLVGTDLLTKYKANIDFEQLYLTLKQKSDTVHIPLLSGNIDTTLTLPARTELVTFVKTNSNEPCVVLNQQLATNVFVASSLAIPTNGEVPIRIMNVRNHPVNIKSFTPTIKDLKHYNVFEYDVDSRNPKRVNQLLSELKLDHLAEDERKTISKICVKYSDIFCLKGDNLTTTHIYKPSINVKLNTCPSYSKPYKIPQFQKAELNSQINKMLANNIIQEAQSEWNSPVLLVPKKSANDSKKWRLVIDYRKVNETLQDDKFPLPNIEEVINSLSGAKYSSHLDLSQGYYQCEIKPEDRAITAFTTPTGQYQMTRLPMGLKISPSSFSRMMTIAMSGLNMEKCLVYLDDLIIFGSTIQQHNRNLIDIFERLRKVNLKLNPEKCNFFKKELIYLGHFISSQGVRPDPEKTECIRAWPIPKNAKEAKRFIAFANYYRKHVENFAKICIPLNRLTRNDTKFIWNKECQQAFDTLKEKFINPPILEYPDFSKDNCFTLHTDASGYAIGAVLSNKNGKPVAYASKALNKAEINYATIEKELLAVVWAVKHFRPFLYGKKFTICTDHRPLVYLFSMREPSSRLTKFRLALEEYEFDITYIQGSRNVVADALSRISSSELKEINDKISQDVLVVTRSQTKKMESKSASPTKKMTDHHLSIEGIAEITIDNNIKSDIQMSACGKKIVLKPAKSLVQLRRIMKSLTDLCTEKQISELVIINNTKCAHEFYKNVVDNDLLKGIPRIHILQKNIKIIHDDNEKQIILNDFHILPTAGHSGIKRTQKTIKKRYFWKNINQDIENFIIKCEQCQKNKILPVKKTPMIVTSTANSAFEKIYLDLVGPLLPDNYGNKYILTTQCELTKYITATPIKDKCSAVVAKAFVEKVILNYGVPQEIATDKGTEFMSALFHDICKLLNIDKLNSVAYHHQSIGALENSHKTLGNFLRIYSGNKVFEWSSWIPYFQFAYNTTCHTETDRTPFELVFGKQCQLPSNLTESNRIDPLSNIDDYSKLLKFKLQTIQTEVRDKLLASKLKRTEKYNANKVFSKFIPGEPILIKQETGTKLDNKYLGPYNIICDKEPNVEIDVNGKTELVHKDRVKKYIK